MHFRRVVLKRFVPLVAVCCVLAVRGAGQSRTLNLLSNPSFEGGEAEWSFWREFPDDAASGVVADASRFGAVSFRVENGGRGGANLFSANVPCEPGKSYTLSVYVKTAGPAAAAVTAWALGEDGTTTLTHGIGGQVSLPPDELPEFVRFRHIFIAPAECTFLRAHLTCRSGIVWWDAVQLELGAQARSYEDADVVAQRVKEMGDGPRNLLPNSSFEGGLPGWRLWCQVPGEASGEVAQATGARGQDAFHVVNRGGGGANVFSDGVDCVPGAVYTLSALVKTVSSSRIKVTGWALDAAEKTLSYSIGDGVAVPATTDGFQRVATTFRAPDEAATLRAHLLCYGGEVWWDAVQLEQGEEMTDYVDGPSKRTYWDEAERYAVALVRDAELRDLLTQVERLLRYGSASGDATTSVAAARRALDGVVGLLQVTRDVPAYETLDYGVLNNAFAGAELELVRAFESLTGRRRSLPNARASRLAGNVSAQRLSEEFLIFPISGYPLERGEVSWRVLAPFEFQAISRMHAQGTLSADGTFDFAAMDKHVALNAEHGFRTVFELPATPRGLLEKLEREIGDGLYFHNAAGEWSPRAHCHNVLNLWSGELTDALCAYFRAMGEHFRDNAQVLAYELVNEPSMEMARPREGGDRYDWDRIGYGGYSAAARAAWHVWLRERYGSVEKLSELWGIEPGAFADIDPPPSLAPPAPVDSRTQHPVAPYYEFCCFRAQAHTQFYARLLEALHEGDPHHAVMSQFCGLNPDRKEAGLDYLDMACKAPWDVFGTHDWPGDRPAVQSLYAASMNRYAGRPHWEDEFIWSQWERKGTPERVMRAAVERNLWRQIAYGKRGIILFNMAGEWAHTKPHNWNNSFLNVEADFQIPRYSTGVFPVLGHKVRAFKQALFRTGLAHTGVAVLRPTASSYAAAPEHRTRDEATALVRWLLAEHWMPLFVPEECVLDAREDLGSFRVLVCPYATHVMSGLEQEILEWVRDGGTLICSGPFGLFDQHGRPQGVLLEQLFGIERLSYDASETRWSVERGNGDPGKAERVLEARHGRGRVWLSLDCVGIERRPEALVEPLRQAFPVQPLCADMPDRSKLELVLRSDDAGQHLLFATNLDPRNALATTVTVAGSCERVRDLCIDGGADVPTRADAGATRIPVYLGPGNGVVYDLGRVRWH